MLQEQEPPNTSTVVPVLPSPSCDLGASPSCDLGEVPSPIPLRLSCLLSSVDLNQNQVVTSFPALSSSRVPPHRALSATGPAALWLHERQRSAPSPFSLLGHLRRAPLARPGCLLGWSRTCTKPSLPAPRSGGPPAAPSTSLLPAERQHPRPQAAPRLTASAARSPRSATAPPLASRDRRPASPPRGPVFGARQ